MSGKTDMLLRHMDRQRASLRNGVMLEDTRLRMLLLIIEVTGAMEREARVSPNPNCPMVRQYFLHHPYLTCMQLTVEPGWLSNRWLLTCEP